MTYVGMAHVVMTYMVAPHIGMANIVTAYLGIAAGDRTHVDVRDAMWQCSNRF